MLDLDVGSGICCGAAADRVLAIIEQREVFPALAHECVDEGADRAVAAAGNTEGGAVDADMSLDAHFASAGEVLTLDREQL